MKFNHKSILKHCFTCKRSFKGMKRAFMPENILSNSRNMNFIKNIPVISSIGLYVRHWQHLSFNLRLFRSKCDNHKLRY